MGSHGSACLRARGAFKCLEFRLQIGTACPRLSFQCCDASELALNYLPEVLEHTSSTTCVSFHAFHESTEGFSNIVFHDNFQHALAHSKSPQGANKVDIDPLMLVILSQIWGAPM